MATLSTVGGWAAIAAVAGGIYWISSRGEKARRPNVHKQLPKAKDSKKDTKNKKAKKDGNTSSGDQEKGQSKNKTQAKPSEREAPAGTSVTLETEHDDEVDNREFARRFAQAKTGISTTPKAKDAGRQKSVKQNKAQEKTLAETSSENATAPSSTTGGDADDDQSPINSPDLAATAMASAVTNGDVSDMLEKATPGPSILRVTESTAPTHVKKAKAPATFEPVETKKQRQNRKKAEAKKMAREEDESERKKLEQEQRRTARVAEGRAAKDGSAFMASKVPSSSAWTAPSPSANGNAAATSNRVDLLDTLDTPVSKPAAPIQAEPSYSESQEAGSKWQNLPSEEEQLAFAVEESSNWKTVEAKDKKKRASKGTQQENFKPKENAQSSADEQQVYDVPPKISPTGPGKKWNVTTVHVENEEVVERQVELQDSEWEVA